jgi:long-subunit fatty acid transport protein
VFTDTFFDQGASAQLSLPDIYHFSIYQRFLRHLALMGDIEWTRWSRLQSIAIKFENAGTPTRWMDIDVGYLHIFLPEGHADVADNHGHIVHGNFSTAANLISAGTTVRWGSAREEKIIAPSQKWGLFRRSSH